MAVVYLSLGTNLGNKYENIKKAIIKIGSVSKIVDVSSIYLTSPVENTNQPWFYNCVVKISTDMLPEKLLEVIKNIEKSIGRKNSTKRYQPRIIDIDILFYGREIIRSEHLSIPHIKAHERAFVLYPMEEISPNFIHPVVHKKISTLKKQLNKPSQKVKLVIPVNRIIADLNLSR